jgi:hypothetical protein
MLQSIATNRQIRTILLLCYIASYTLLEKPRNMKIALQVEEQAGALPKEQGNRYTASGKVQHVQGANRTSMELPVAAEKQWIHHLEPWKPGEATPTPVFPEVNGLHAPTFSHFTSRRKRDRFYLGRLRYGYRISSTVSLTYVPTLFMFLTTPLATSPAFLWNLQVQ